jgi:hypothetical protein
MAPAAKRKWTSPEVRRFGTFEQATQGCNKTYGDSDGFLFQGAPITCASGS